jgi:UDP-glucose 4-epimerase
MFDLSSFTDKRVLITGGLGFIGGNLAHALAGRCAELTLVDSLIPQYGGNLFNISGIEDQVRVNIADVRDESSMRYLVRNKEIIFNLAGQVSHLDSMHDPFTDLDINCRSQLAILEACRKNAPDAKIVFAGTRGQYGRVETLPATEETPMRPTDVNGIDKIAGENYHLLYHRVYGIRACSLRLTNTYGPRHHMRTSRQGVLSWFIRLAIDGRTIQLFGGGEQQRDFNYIDDVVEAFLLAAGMDAADGEAFNVGSGRPTSLREAAELAVRVAGRGKVEIVEFPPDKKRIEIGNYYADCRKIERALGWKARTPLEEGVKRTVEFFRRHKLRYWDNDE